MRTEYPATPHSLETDLKNNETAEFQGFFVKVISKVERRQRQLEYGPLFNVHRKSASVLITSLWLDRKSQDHAYVLVAEDGDGTVVGVRNAHVNLKKREAQGYVYVRNRGQGVGSIMEVANLMFLGSVATTIKQNITQIYCDQNYHDLKEIEKKGQKDDPVHQAVVARKRLERKRWESIYGAYGIAGLTDNLRRKIEWRKNCHLPDECITEVISTDTGNYIDPISPPVQVNRYDLSIKTCEWIELAYSYMQ